MTATPIRILLWAPTASSRSLIAAGLAAALRAQVVDGDELARRVAHDRGLWLRALGYALSDSAAVVVASAPLARTERDALAAAVAGLWWVELVDVEPVRAPRRRRGHVDSDVAQPMQPLAADESGVRVADDAGLDDVVARVADLYRRGHQSLR